MKENLHSPKKSSQCGSDISDSPSQYKRDAPPYKDPPAPPPYRDPPPPNAALEAKYKKSLLQDFNKPLNKNQETVLYNTQYRELINLVNYQREKLSTQHADLTKVNFSLILYFRYSYSESIIEIGFIKHTSLLLIKFFAIFHFK